MSRLSRAPGRRAILQRLTDVLPPAGPWWLDRALLLGAARRRGLWPWQAWLVASAPAPERLAAAVRAGGPRRPDGSAPPQARQRSVTEPLLAGVSGLARDMTTNSLAERAVLHVAA